MPQAILALIVFMFLLGVIFESGRERAFAKMSEANTKLATSNDQLARLNQEKNEFLGIAAHDLKNPLTVIIGSAELLKMNLPPAQATKMASNIVGAGQRMFQLIKDLLDANAIEQGKFTSNIVPCDLRAVANECAGNNQTHATRKQIVIVTEEGPAVWGLADRNATLQILDNLMSNAVKFSPHHSTVQVKLTTANGYVCIDVKDQGPGLSAADQKKLFGKFTRLSAQPTGGESSTGLGLSIVKKLAEAMAGTVVCESELGAGATFSLRLPVCEAAETSSRPQPVDSSAKKIPTQLDRDVQPAAPNSTQPSASTGARRLSLSARFAPLRKLCAPEFPARAAGDPRLPAPSPASLWRPRNHRPAGTTAAPRQVDPIDRHNRRD
jgi:signal transduction histidine kinase